MHTKFRALRRLGGTDIWPSPLKPCTEVRPLPPELEALPGKVQCAVKDGVIQAFRGAPPVSVIRAPHETPPFRSVPLNQTFILIVGSQDVVTLASMAELSLAATGASAGVPTVLASPLDGASPVPWLTLLPHTGERIHLSGVEIKPSSLDAYNFLEFTADIGGETVIDRVGPEGLEEVSIDAPPETQLTLSVANRDPASAFLLYVTVKGWKYTVKGSGNYLSETVLSEDGAWSTPQTGCAPDERGHGGCS